MDENLTITILEEHQHEDEKDDDMLVNTSILFSEDVYPSSKKSINELSLLNTIVERIDEENNIKEEDEEKEHEINEIVVQKSNEEIIEEENYEESHIISSLLTEEISNKIEDISKSKKIEDIKTNINTVDTHILNFKEVKEDNSIFISKINQLEEQLKEFQNKQAEHTEIKYSFNRINKVNIIETYIKKYNLKYEFNKEQLMELGDDEFNKIYYNIYNINESRKNSLLYYGVCFFIVWMVDYAHKKINKTSKKNLFEKFTYEVFHDNLSDSFVMFESEYLPSSDKLGNPFINIGKFLLYFCFINLMYDTPPSNLKI